MDNDARENFLNEMNQVFEQILEDKTNIKPLTYVPAGTRIIVFPNVDLWLRTEERDAEATAANMKKDVLIDDEKVQGERKLQENQRAVEMSGAAGSNVVYAPENSDVEAVSGPKLINDNSATAKTQQSAVSGTVPPPPTSTATTNNTKSSSSSSGNNNSVPQLF